jgi:3-phosphoshikimate 1-carboxyvinyltransferase
VAVPGDKSISHRVALFGLIADGPCRSTGWLDSEDTRSSLEAVRRLGASVTLDGDALTVAPPASPPRAAVTIDCGNSGTTARLLMGILAGWLPAGAAGVTLTGDASLSGRPMNRVVDPLRRMGADITWLGEPGRLPLLVRGASLRGADHVLPVPSAQVKSALLLAGLFATGRTAITGAGGSRDHTELLLQGMGVDCDAAGGTGELAVTGPVRPGPLDIRVPGDPSAAAFFQVAAAIVPGSTVTSLGQSLNYTRTGALRVLKSAGVKVAVTRPFGAPGGEPAGDVEVTAAEIVPFKITAPDVPALVDEIPVLAVLATQARGVTVISGAEDLRVKESDRLAMMASNLKRLGAHVTELPDGLRIEGPTALRGGPVDRPVVFETAGDHRIAMAMAVAALVARGDSVLDDEACVAVSFPQFFMTLEKLLPPG